MLPLAWFALVSLAVVCIGAVVALIIQEVKEERDIET